MGETGFVWEYHEFGFRQVFKVPFRLMTPRPSRTVKQAGGYMGCKLRRERARMERIDLGVVGT